jgi:RNAse (barnase) inhibitor barstar
LRLEYKSDKVKSQCTNLKEATKLFGGDKQLSVKLLSRINALREAEVIHDIIVQSVFRFHGLKNKKGRNLDGLFAIDVKTIKEPWRIILQPLNDNKEPFVPCNIDEISGIVRVVEIREVSNHYE